MHIVLFLYIALHWVVGTLQPVSTINKDQHAFLHMLSQLPTACFRAEEGSMIDQLLCLLVTCTYVFSLDLGQAMCRALQKLQEHSHLRERRLSVSSRLTCNIQSAVVWPVHLCIK